jgi:hypothetical protein
VWLLASCSKSTTNYNTISNPAYFRVFNSLTYDPSIPTKDQPHPFLTMIIDPEFDKSGQVTGGKVVGDFLDRRGPFAAPFPVGNPDYKNKEYPGNSKVLVGPILNGINLSSWAQIPPGKHRMVFYVRPVNSTPFFDLNYRDRQTIMVDSTVDLSSGEVYTMEVLQKSIPAHPPIPVELYVRTEQFTKMPFNDTLLYVNFYNLSAVGYAAANPGPRDPSLYYTASNATAAFGDTMNITYSLYKDDVPYPFNVSSNLGTTLISGYNVLWLGTVVRSHSDKTAPYYSIPLFAAPDTTGGILSTQWELFVLTAPGYAPANGPQPFPGIGALTASPAYGVIGCSNFANDGKYSDNFPPQAGDNYELLASTWLPNLINYTASGTHKQQSFATISSIEIINGFVYMMSVQRTYPPPVN